MVGLLLGTILLGIHVGVALAVLSFAGVWWVKGSFSIALKLLGIAAFGAVSDYVFGVLPLFVLMGLASALSGATADLYNAANVLMPRVRGRLAIATVQANAVFAAITGVSVASAAIFSKVALPEMLRLGYDKRFALGTVGGSSVLGMLIPPSVLFIIYGILAEQSIGKLFIAGIVPGLVLTAVYVAGISLMVRRNPRLVGGERAVRLANGERWRALGKVWPTATLIALVLGGIYGGLFTPTEAGAVGACGALVLAWLKRRLTWGGLWDTLLETGHATAAIFFLLIAASMYSRMLTLTGLPSRFGELVTGLDLPAHAVIGLFVVIFLVLGTILDSTSIMLVSIPLMLPVVRALGFDVMWFGVVSVVAVEIGLLTPPFGMVVFAMKAVLGDGASLEEIFQGTTPFMAMMLFVLGLLILFPSLSTWLPWLV
ncbi:MAG: TRAP transporter large permease [Candidatus Rokubacteria bacterium]|nr:TRAP transporter large permease [Candidatus Rokubacteria bacterium]